MHAHLTMYALSSFAVQQFSTTLRAAAGMLFLYLVRSTLISHIPQADRGND
jgi:hypothetical protein